MLRRMTERILRNTPFGGESVKKSVFSVGEDSRQEKIDQKIDEHRELLESLVTRLDQRLEEEDLSEVLPGLIKGPFGLYRLEPVGFYLLQAGRDFYENTLEFTALILMATADDKRLTFVVLTINDAKVLDPVWGSVPPAPLKDMPDSVFSELLRRFEVGIPALHALRERVE